jgi:hypothetical protein
MTLKKNASQIGSLLNKLPKAKTNQEKLYLVFRIKLLVEIIEGQIQKRKPDAVAAAKKQIIKKALGQLLTALDAIFDKHEEVGDTAVREKMSDAIHNGFIVPQKGYKIPESFGMFSDRGNQLVRSSIEKFLAHPEVVTAGKTLKIPEERLNAFRDGDVKSVEGNTFDEYFEYSNMPKDPAARGLVCRF